MQGKEPILRLGRTAGVIHCSVSRKEPGLPVEGTVSVPRESCHLAPRGRTRISRLQVSFLHQSGSCCVLFVEQSLGASELSAEDLRQHPKLSLSSPGHLGPSLGRQPTSELLFLILLLGRCCGHLCLCKYQLVVSGCRWLPFLGFKPLVNFAGQELFQEPQASTKQPHNTGLHQRLQTCVHMAWK